MDQKILFFNAKILSASGVIDPGWLLVENRSIVQIGKGSPPASMGGVETIDASGSTLAPGLIDLHVHGAVGREVMDANPDGILEIARFLATRGVTAFLAATWTAPQPKIQQALKVIVDSYGHIRDGASLVGAYLEGPYLNPNRAGAQDMNLIRQAVEQAEALSYLESGLVRIVALAPEYPENMWLVDECVKRGIAVAAAHTNATYEEMEIAVKHGVSLLTHCFNAMSPFHHRQPGAAGAGLVLKELRCELIADNIHVHPVVQKILYQARGCQGIVLVSDCVRATGLPEGEYDLDGRKVKVKNGAVHLPDGTLAGSVLTLDTALKNFMAAANLPLEEAILSASLYPARAIGIAHYKGVLDIGHDADILLLDRDMNLLLTMVEGKIVYKP